MEHLDNVHRGLRPTDRLAIERLLDQQELATSAADLEQRTTRRLCGLWLMQRRLARGMTVDDLALRTDVPPELLTLIELGTADSPLVSDESWRRLSLVLEGGERDFQRVAEVIRAAIGEHMQVDPALIEQQVSLAQSEEPAGADETLDPQLLQQADQLLQSKGKLPRHNLLVLQTLRRAGRRALNSFEIKRDVEELAHVSLNLADLPTLLNRLTTARLVTRTEGDPPVYQITARGDQACVAALRRTAADRQLDEALDRRIQPKPSGA